MQARFIEVRSRRRIVEIDLDAVSVTSSTSNHKNSRHIVDQDISNNTIIQLQRNLAGQRVSLRQRPENPEVYAHLIIEDPTQYKMSEAMKLSQIEGRHGVVHYFRVLETFNDEQFGTIEERARRLDQTIKNLATAQRNDRIRIVGYHLGFPTSDPGTDNRSPVRDASIRDATNKLFTYF